MQGIEHMLVSLPLICTPVTPAPALQYKEGPIAHLDAVLQQYIAAHHLQPLRLFITGAPAAGKSEIASRHAYCRDCIIHTQLCCAVMYNAENSARPGKCRCTLLTTDFVYNTLILMSVLPVQVPSCL